ncbi:MAG: hypothetical protein ACUVUS_02085 [Thermoproteota archaeon]
MAKVSVVKLPRKCFDEEVFNGVKQSIDLIGVPRLLLSLVTEWL